MHMINKKDLSDAERDTLPKSCSPTIVKIANGGSTDVREPQNMSKNWNFFDHESHRKHASSIVAWKALRCSSDTRSFHSSWFCRRSNMSVLVSLQTRTCFTWLRLLSALRSLRRTSCCRI